MLAALSSTPVTLTGALFSEDTELMAAALRAMGFKVAASSQEGTVLLGEQAGAYPASSTARNPTSLFVGLAGTAARFLTALCAAAPRGVYRLDGVPQMRKRPMRPLVEALRSLGVTINCLGEEGFFPLEIAGGSLRGGTVRLDASESSQLLSALLMIAPCAPQPIKVELVGTVRRSFVDMSLRLMAEFGVTVSASSDGRSFIVRPAPYRAPPVHGIEPDATAASYFQALPLVVGGSLHLPGLRPPGAGLQGDSAFIDVLQRVKARPEGRPLSENFHEISDTFLTLAAIAPLLKGTTHISGIAHTRKQETDRVAGMANELRRLGQEVVEAEDALTIVPRPLRRDQVIETYGDHRFAMSFGVLGSHNLRGDGTPWLTVRDPACCAKTFPEFFELLATLRQNSLQA